MHYKAACIIIFIIMYHERVMTESLQLLRVNGQTEIADDYSVRIITSRCEFLDDGATV